MNNIDKNYEALFTPWKIGNVEIKNRIVMCPMGGTSLFGWFELGGCHFDKEAAKLFLERANNNVSHLFVTPFGANGCGRILKCSKNSKSSWTKFIKQAPSFSFSSLQVWAEAGLSQSL